MEFMFDFGIERMFLRGTTWVIYFACGCDGLTQEGRMPGPGIYTPKFHAVHVAPVFCHSGCDYSHALERI